MCLNIIYILNDAYWMPVLVSAKSALICEGSNASRISFVLIVDGVSEEHRQVLEKELATKNSTVIFVEPDMAVFDGLPDYHGSKLVWTRCKLNQILPDLQGWACICDGDTLWLRSPTELFSFVEEYSNNVIVAGSVGREGEDYFCLGFALVHLDRMREFGAERKCEEYLKTHPIPRWLEQDIFNEIFATRKRILPAEWGVSPVWGLERIPADQIGVIHYFGALPWPSSGLRRMMDVHVLWWHLAHDLMKLPQEDDRFRMNVALRTIMRFTNFALPFVPEFLKGKHLKACAQGVKLPLKQMLKEMDERYENV